MKTKKDVELMFEAALNAEPVKASMLIELPVELPEGTVGYMLVKTADGVEWAAVPVELPAVGTSGHVLTKTEAGYEWAAIPAVEHPIPELPTVDGEYKLVIVDGVASWVLIA